MAGNGGRDRAASRAALPHRLLLARELRQIVPVIDRRPTEALPRTHDLRAVAADDRDGRGPGARDDMR